MNELLEYLKKQIWCTRNDYDRVEFYIKKYYEKKNIEDMIDNLSEEYLREIIKQKIK